MGGDHGYQLAVTKAENPTTAAPADTYPATGPADDEAPDAETTAAATTATTAAPTTATTAASTTARKDIPVLPKWVGDLPNGRVCP
ncbi:mucin like 1 [Homo sapiens]|uniref:Mucin like 1 n=1 Tax=Homo sapiens TaxID=9606 RepID=F8VV13_HUMAN|nr:mucin like 1 [Homo sapiens]KAI4066384.1 mucin like 1 [Homo sapiens]